jgi:hypothetical protein
LHNGDLIVTLNTKSYFIAFIHKTEMNLSLQDLASIVGPLGALMGFMWYHFNNRSEKTDTRIDNLRGDLNRVEEKLDKKIDTLRGELNGVEKRLDEKISSVEKRLDEKISGVEKRLDEKISSVEKKLDEKLSSVEKGLGEKIDAACDRISRIEGQLVPAKVIAFEEIRSKEITGQRNAIKQS